jgi:hypothetical protein
VDTDRRPSLCEATATAGGGSAWLWALGGLASLALAVSLLLATVSWVGSSDPRSPAVAVAETRSEAGYEVWAVNDDGQPVRWDPCRPIEVVLSPDGAPGGAAADLDEAVARLAAASGLELVAAGTTDERPGAARLPYQPERYGERWAPILVAWATPADAGLPLRTTDRGVAIPVAGGPPGDRTFLTAQVVLNRGRDDLIAGFADRADSWGATLLHELLHALGLAHVDDPDQLMAVYPGSGPVELGDGDLAGLSAVGAQNGCHPAPPPGPITVAPPEAHRP